MGNWYGDLGRDLERMALPTYDKQGKIIQSGKVKSRLPVLDQRFAGSIVYIRTEENSKNMFFSLRKRSFIKLEEKEGNQLWINISSFARRYHLSKQEILETGKNSQALFKLLKARYRLLSSLTNQEINSLSRYYKRIYNHYLGVRKSSGCLIARNNFSTDIRKEDLITIILSAFCNALKADHFHNAKKIKVQMKNKKIQIASLLEGRDLKIIRFDNLIKMAENEKNIFSQIFQIDKGEYQGIKFPKRIEPSNPSPYEKEMEILDFLHQEKIEEFIQDPPHICIEFEYKKNAGGELLKGVGYIFPLYSGGNLKQFMGRFSKYHPSHIYGCRDLVNALDLATRKNIGHGNICLENIFVQYREENLDRPFIWKLCGWENAINFNREGYVKDLKKIYPYYCCGNEMRLLIDLLNKNHYEEAKKVHDKINVLALGITIYEAFTNSIPFELLENKREGHTNFWVDLNNDNVFSYKLLNGRMVLLNFDPKPLEDNGYNKVFISWLYFLLAPLKYRYTPEELKRSFDLLERNFLIS